MALLAESSTGAVFGMNIPGTSALFRPLISSKVSYNVSVCVCMCLCVCVCVCVCACVSTDEALPLLKSC
jgi:hypothetical protein